MNISAMFTENIKFPPKEKQFEGEPCALSQSTCSTLEEEEDDEVLHK